MAKKSNNPVGVHFPNPAGHRHMQGTRFETIRELPDGDPFEDSLIHVRVSTVRFRDADHSVVLVTAEPLNNGYLGIFELGPVHPAANAFSYKFELPEGVIDPLQADQVIWQFYAVTLQDRHGNQATGYVRIKIVGTNDAPVITSAPQTGSVKENGQCGRADGAMVHIQTGSVTFCDVDALDTHTASFTALGSTYLGTFSIGPVDQTDDAITWSFQVFDNVLDRLGAEDVLTQQYVVTVDDGHGGKASTTVTVTIHGCCDDTENPASRFPSAGTESIVVDEEGLKGGIKDALVSGDVDGEDTGATGLLPHDFNGDGPAANDPISLAGLTGQAVKETGGAVVTTDGVPLTYFWDSEGDTLYASSDVSSLANARITAAFKIVLNTSTGAYAYTLCRPLDHPDGSAEDDIEIDVPYVVNDSNGDAATGALSMRINDDSPAPGKVIAILTEGQADTNVLLIVDISGSMAESSGLAGLTRLDVTKAAVNELLEQYDHVGNVMVRIVAFSTGANAIGMTWQSVDTAKAVVSSLQPAGSTNYDGALAAAMDAFDAAGQLSGALNVSYFISDGEPNRPWGSAGVDGVERSVWENFLLTNRIVSHALGVGGAIAVSNLDPMAFSGAANARIPSMVVTDPSQLATTLVGATKSGNVFADGGGDFGADGPGMIRSVGFEGETFTYDRITDQIAESGPASATQSFDTTRHVLTVTTGEGVLSIDLDDGNYSFVAPSVILSDLSVIFNIGFVDSDGDLATSNLTFTINNANLPPVARDDHVLSNVSGSGATISIPDFALLYNDFDPEGQPVALSLIVSANEGTVAHATSSTAFTDDDTNGGTFIYQAMTKGPSGADPGVVTVERDTSCTLMGTGLADILIGRASSSMLNGAEGNDVIIGGAADDMLTGGSGADAFLFKFLGTIDTVTDFLSGTDNIVLDSTIFSQLAPGGLGAAAFTTGASDADTRVAYSQATGQLFYDPDGAGGTSPIQIALLGASGAHPVLASGDFIIL